MSAELAAIPEGSPQKSIRGGGKASPRWISALIERRYRKAAGHAGGPPLL